MIYKYPAIFRVDKEDSKRINVSFPDIFGGVTCGIGKENAIFMAKDLLKLMIQRAPNQCEKPSSIEEIQHKFPGEEVIIIEVEIDE